MDLVKIPATMLAEIGYELQTDYENDLFPLFSKKKHSMYLQLDEESDLSLSNNYVITPSLALFIHEQVEKIGKQNLIDNYKRYQKINSASYDYNAYHLHPLIKQWVEEGKLDDKSAEEIATMSAQMQDLNNSNNETY